MKNYIFAFLTTAVTALSITACGGGASDTTTPNEKGRVGVILTDAPTQAFDEINITINRIVLIGDDNDNVTLFEGEKTVNLLSLKNYGELFSLADVPAGEYSKIRLIVKHPNGIELIRKDENGNVAERIYPQQPGNGKLDLNPRGHFRVTANTTTYIQLDIDAAKSIHIVETGNGKYIFRPVIFVDLLSDTVTGKLVRQVGFVETIDAVNNHFRLCPNVAAPDSNTSYCVDVDSGRATVFNDKAEPVGLDQLTENQFAMVVGFIDTKHFSDDKSNDDDSHKDDDHGKHVHRSKTNSFALRAEVIELGALGQYQVLNGSTSATPTDMSTVFGLKISEQSSVDVQLQPDAKIFARNGTRLTVDAIKADMPFSVDGVWSDETKTKLSATLLIVDSPEVVDATAIHITGSVASVDSDAKSIVVTSANGDTSVKTKDSTKFFQISANNENALSNRIELSAVKAGMRIDVYGYRSSDGTQYAQVVIVE